MSTVSMTCPKCGATLKRKNELFFTHCPYCGVELAFDEINEESTDQVRKKIVEWKKMRDIYYLVLGVLSFLGDVLMDTRDFTWSLVALVLTGISWLMFIIVPIVMGAKYPSYNLLTNKEDKGARVKKWAELVLISLCVITAAALAGYNVAGFIKSRH